MMQLCQFIAFRTTGPSFGVSHRVPKLEWTIEGICAINGISVILSPDIRENILACYPTGRSNQELI